MELFFHLNFKKFWEVIVYHYGDGPFEMIEKRGKLSNGKENQKKTKKKTKTFDELAEMLKKLEEKIKEKLEKGYRLSSEKEDIERLSPFELSEAEEENNTMEKLEEKQISINVDEFSFKGEYMERESEGDQYFFQIIINENILDITEGIIGANKIKSDRKFFPDYREASVFFKKTVGEKIVAGYKTCYSNFP